MDEVIPSSPDACTKSQIRRKVVNNEIKFYIKRKRSSTTCSDPAKDISLLKKMPNVLINADDQENIKSLVPISAQADKTERNSLTSDPTIFRELKADSDSLNTDDLFNSDTNNPDIHLIVKSKDIEVSNFD